MFSVSEEEGGGDESDGPGREKVKRKEKEESKEKESSGRMCDGERSEGIMKRDRGGRGITLMVLREEVSSWWTMEWLNRFWVFVIRNPSCPDLGHLEHRPVAGSRNGHATWRLLRHPALPQIQGPPRERRWKKRETRQETKNNNDCAFGQLGRRGFIYLSYLGNPQLDVFQAYMGVFKTSHGSRSVLRHFGTRYTTCVLAHRVAYDRKGKRQKRIY
ncbi:hypothetical protein GGS23DRAFT_84779 [Durotheca rogersii]|uniref:uncharacterized protein n=1 Tax=Durotheca rogersii TaxID=419775 RepID=UPI002220F04F|nr:uncharacterized protein GGS23DRAFT_84779 [Durotheca rogersii]KAI5862627.1 hypothetical protein GGS23DRAFT_84779 [Durotheca rogersii]